MPGQSKVRGTVSGCPKSVTWYRSHQSHGLQETRQLECSFPVQKLQEAGLSQCQQVNLCMVHTKFKGAEGSRVGAAGSLWGLGKAGWGDGPPGNYWRCVR